MIVPRLAHGIKATLRVGFDRVVEVLKSIGTASSIYFEVLPTKPRVALFIGEKYFFRAGNYLLATTMVVERSDGVEIKIVAGGGKESLLDLFDLGASRDYARMILDEVCRALGVKPENVVEVHYLEVKDSAKLWSSI